MYYTNCEHDWRQPSSLKWSKQASKRSSLPVAGWRSAGWMWSERMWSSMEHIGVCSTGPSVRRAIHDGSFILFGFVVGRLLLSLRKPSLARPPPIFPGPLSLHREKKNWEFGRERDRETPPSPIPSTTLCGWWKTLRDIFFFFDQTSRSSAVGSSQQQCDGIIHIVWKRGKELFVQQPAVN